MLREYVPEIVNIVLVFEIQVVVVVPLRDALSTPVRDCASAIFGAVLEHVDSKGPAYRTVPKSSLPLYQLYVTECDLKILVDSPAPKEVVEVFAGLPVLTPQLVQIGFATRAYECAIQPGGLPPEGDFVHVENQTELADCLRAGQVFHLNLSPSLIQPLRAYRQA